MTTTRALSNRSAPTVPEPENPPPQPGNDLHVWTARADDPTLANGWLDHAEQQRRNRYRQPMDRLRFTAGRALLRRALAYYCGRAPGRLQFGLSPYGKPYLRASSGPEFNLSHAGDWIACVVARTPCGIDVEPVRTLADSDALARRICSPGDYMHWRTRDTGARDRMLFQHWVVLEARSKAAGRGLADMPERSDPRQTPTHCAATALWQPAPGYWLAAAAMQPIERVRWWRYPGSQATDKHEHMAGNQTV